MSTKSIPAFPVPLNPGQIWDEMGPCDGMTLRDHFAGLALQAIIATDGTYNWEDRARDAWEAADAMLDARDQ